MRTEPVGMRLAYVHELLGERGIEVPVLNVQEPNERDFKALVLQPSGHLIPTPGGMKHRDAAESAPKFRSFLTLASSNDVDVAVAPEYAIPWPVLLQTLSDGEGPAVGAIWALGCEGTTMVELGEWASRLLEHATVIHETLPPDPERFVSPMAYVLRAPHRADARERQFVVIVQFKTMAMGGSTYYEHDGLQVGRMVYVFGGANRIQLATLICADAFSLTDAEAKILHDRALILHLQLNPEPRHDAFLGCRNRLLDFGNDTTDILALNWARGMTVFVDEAAKSAVTDACSAWFTKTRQFDDRDDVVNGSHRRGLYYTWRESGHCHALLLNYDEGLYFITSSKAAHVGVRGAISRRLGPRLRESRTWADGAWTETPSMNDGFAQAVTLSGAAADDLRSAAAEGPLHAERLIALSAGDIAVPFQNWHSIAKLSPCRLATDETCLRVTFCQDESEVAESSRSGRLRQCAQLHAALSQGDVLPVALHDLRGGFTLVWSREHPHQNVLSVRGSRATAVYVGEGASPGRLDRVSRVMHDLLQRCSMTADEKDTAWQRTAIIFRADDGSLRLFDAAPRTGFADPRTESPFDIAGDR